MIRRKLTRLEVTLDDTKELDELFSSTKCHQISLINTSTNINSTNPTTNISKLTSSFHQKHLVLAGRGASTIDYDPSNSIGDTSHTKANSISLSADEPAINLSIYNNS